MSTFNHNDKFFITSGGNATFAGTVTVNGGQILTPSGVNLALNPNTGLVTVGGVIQCTGTGTSTFAGSVKTEGPDGGLILRTWTGGSSYGSFSTANMSGNEYAVLTDGTHTFISGGTGGSVHIRAGNNVSNHELEITSNLATFKGNLQVNGDLNIVGNSSVVNVEDLNVEQGEITLNYNASSDTSGSANGSGIRIQDAVNSTTDATMSWNTTTDRFDFSHALTTATGTVRFTHQQNGGSRLELYNNRQDLSNVEVYRIAAYNAAEVTGVHFYRGSGGSSGYTKIFAKKDNSSSLEEVVQFGANGALNTTFAGTVKGTTYLVNHTSAAGIGASLGDINSAELGPGYLSLSRDDTADAKQIVFEKNDAEHSYLQTTSTGLTIGGAYVGMGIAATSNQRLNLAEADANGSHIKMTNSRSGGGYWVNGVGDSGSSSSITPAGGIFWYNGATRMVIDSSGDVGIGITSPTSKIDVRENANNVYTGYFYNSNTGSTAHGINVQTASTDADAYAFRVNSASNSNALVVKGNANVGIGTASPNGKLDIQYDMDVNTGGITTLTSGQSQYGSINFSGVTDQSAGATGTTMQGLTWQVNDYNGTTDYGVQAQLVVGNNGSVGTFMGFFTSANYSAAPNERLRITSGGEVGIGTTDPQSKLHVSGANTVGRFESSTSYVDLIFQNSGGTGGFLNFNGTSSFNVYVGGGSAANNKMTVLSSGNVGVGTTSPQEKLHIFNDSASWNEFANIRLSTESDSFAAEVGFHRGTTDNTNRGLFLSGDGTNKHLHVGYTGLVGIGTDTPDDALLHVYDTVNRGGTGNLRLTNTSNTQTVLLLENTTSRKYELAVGGSANSIGNGSFYIYDVNAGASRFEINSSGNATFAGNIGIGNPTVLTHALNINVPSGTTKGIYFMDSGNDHYGTKIQYTEATNLFSIIQEENNVQTGSFSIERANGNATFSGNVTAGNSSTDVTIRAHHDDGAYVDHTGYGIQFARNASYLRPDADGTRTMYFGGSSHTWNAINFDSNSYTFQKNGVTLSLLEDTGMKVYSTIGSSDNVRTGLAHYDDTAQGAGVGGQLVLGYKYTDAGAYTEGAIIKMYKENGTSGNYGSGLKFQVRNHGNNLSTKVTITPSGDVDATGNVDATNFRDRDDTSYSLTPDSSATGQWQVNTPSGNVRIGPANTTYSHFSTDRSRFYMNKQLVVDQGIISSYNEDLRLRRTESNNDSILITDTDISFILDGAEDMRLQNDGDLHVEGDVIAYSTTVSDNRLKDDVVTIDSALDKVSKLRGVEYTWNNTSRKGQKDIGVIAQEVEEVIPEIVREKEMSLMDGKKYKTVDYEKLTAVLIEAVKELKEEVEELKNKCNDCTC